MQDGYTQVGAGQSDMRLAGEDLQHHGQTRTADEMHVPVRMVTQAAGAGGPMKEHMDHEQHGLKHHIEMEEHRHNEAKEHVQHHMERHHKRDHNSQHGHDHYRYN